MRKFIDIVENVATLDDDAADTAILQDMFSRANVEEFRAWALENGAEEEDLADPDLMLHEFSYWLEQERAIRVRNGAVEFWKLDHDCVRLIGDNPVILYHFTAKSRVPSIRQHGLEGNRPSVNRRKSEGVYLTTETSGPAINGYIRNATKGRGDAVCITVKTTLADLSPDPDDEDIQSGETQFVTAYVAPSQIIEID